MKKNIYLPLLCMIALLSCNNDDSKTTDSENDIDAARNFIQSALNSDYSKARLYMVQDTPNINQMSAMERIHLSPDETKGLAEATINIHKVNKLNDSTTVIVYSNSFKNNWDTLRVKKQAGKWLVDFNYIWTHDQDSSTVLPVLKTDSLPVK